MNRTTFIVEAGFFPRCLMVRLFCAGAVVMALPCAGLTAQQQKPSTPSAQTPADKTGPNAHGPSGYRIGAGDELQVSVWNEPQASVPSVVVRPDGKISLPLIKELDVNGMTPAELEKILTGKLEPLIHGADVTVVVKAIHSKKVYLVGSVKKEGPVLLLSPMTVLQVLAEAGGITEYAKKKKIYVLRTENGKQVKLPFDYDAVIKGEHMEQNIQVLPDDTIVVP
ncbi:MAG TPA: polysaccharide biosynthesis/export family protein [Bryobacteraceae bacterium]|nr:polysaccharide biosynthesis/export family protein [Bryobacteraceae bacterium]